MSPSPQGPTTDHYPLPHLYGTDDSVEGSTFCFGGRRPNETKVHQILSTRIAVALNSAVPDLGSHASMVSRLTSDWSG